MRRTDREVTDSKEIIEILERCATVRIGINGDDYPYVVPVSFGVEVMNGKPVVYFHCAKSGMKMELMRLNPNVCVEGDAFLGVQKTAHGITTRYESVIGFGKCVIAEDASDIVKGLRLILEHYGQTEYPIERCRGMENLNVCKITLDRVFGKRNLPEEM